MGYGVIGSPTDSGSVSLGSSPGTPAPQLDRGAVLFHRTKLKVTGAPSSSGPGRRPLKAVAPVRIRSGLQLSKRLLSGSPPPGSRFAVPPARRCPRPAAPEREDHVDEQGLPALLRGLVRPGAQHSISA